jgi:hypothetical protein
MTVGGLVTIVDARFRFKAKTPHALALSPVTGVETIGVQYEQGRHGRAAGKLKSKGPAHEA